MVDELNFDSDRDSKVCGMCGQTKALNAYYLQSGRPQRRCRECVRTAAQSRYANGGKEQARKRYQDNPDLQEKAKARAKDRWRKNKESIQKRQNERRKKRREDPAQRAKEQEQWREQWRKRTRTDREARERREYERLKAKFEENATKGSDGL